MNWLTKASEAIKAMGRPRADMLALIKSDMRDTVQDHLWKLFAYHTVRPNDVKGWIDTIEARREKFSRYNKPLGKKGANFGEDALKGFFVTELFEEDDCIHLMKTFARQGYPEIWLSEFDRKRLTLLATKFVHCVIEDAEFQVGSSELLKSLL